MIRWVASEKIAILGQLDREEVTLDEINITHGITEEEINEWRLRYKQFGINGLKATKTTSVRRRAKHGLCA